MKVSVVVSRGVGKAKCEDAVLLSDSVISDCDMETELETPSVICVADGVGGNLGGEFASRFLLGKIANLQNVDYTEDVLNDALIKINKELLTYADETEDKKQMATTLTGLFIGKDKMFYAQSGNTRLYVMQGNYLKQITKDHTTYQWLMDCGNEEAAESCNKNEIRCCFGGGTEKYLGQLLVKSIENYSNVSTMLLTSDGIHEYVDIDTLEELLTSGDSDLDIVREMCQIAEDNGSKDDRTAVLIRR